MTKNAPRCRATLGTAVSALSVLALSALTACGGAEGTVTKDAVPKGSVSEVTVASSRPAPSQAGVTAKIRRLEKARDVRIGAYAIDTGTGRFVGHRAHETFPYTSTFKVMACGAVLRKSRVSEPGLMDRVIHYSESDLVDYSPVTEKHVETGMTVAELCHAAITRSDNTAGNLILRQIGGPSGLTAFFRSLGDRVSRSDRWETDLNDWRPGEKRDTTSPRPWARNLRALTTGDALVPADSERLADWMKATVTGDNRIRAGLPGDWTVGDKTGTGGAYGTANDIAIAWPPSGAPLVIVILTSRRDADGGADEKAIAQTAGILARALR